MSLNVELKRHAKLVAREVKAGKASTLSRRARDFMEEHPDAVLGVIDLVHREANRTKPNDEMIKVYGYLFGTGLELLRYQVEGQHGWAEALVDEVRELLLSLAKDEVISPQLLIFLINGFIEARLDPGEELSELAGKMATDAAMSGPSLDLPDMTGLLDALAEQSGGNEFDLHTSLGEVSRAFPPGFRQNFVRFAVTSKNPVLRDTAILYLLDSSPEVREATCHAITEYGSPSSVSPVALRRMIALRNWLPEEQRHDLDVAIKKTRQKRVECAPWPKRRVEDIFASAMDGAGAQSVFAVVKDGRKRVIAGLLVKQGVGIADAWCMRGQSKAEVRDLLAEVDSEMETISVKLDFLHLLVPHYLAVAQQAGSVPAAGFLDFVEAIGIETWQPAELPAAGLITRMEKDVDRARLGRQAIDDAVERSGGWFDKLGITGSWFEADAEVVAVLAKKPRSKTPAKVDAILESVLEPRRDKWVERFLWTALWLQQDPDSHAPWTDFFIVGRELHRGRPVREVPVMRGIAEATVLSDRMRIDPSLP